MQAEFPWQMRSRRQNANSTSLVKLTCYKQRRLLMLTILPCAETDACMVQEDV